MRLLSFELIGIIAAFVVLVRPKNRDQRTAHDGLQVQAIELRVEEKERTRTVRLPLPLTIGRGANATLVISDAQVSRMHARLGILDGKLDVRDLDSRNGTLLNARPLDKSALLAEGDEITVGSARIIVGRLVPWT